MISFNYYKNQPTKSADEALMNFFNSMEGKLTTRNQKSIESTA